MKLVPMVAPSGVKVNTSEERVPELMKLGYRRRATKEAPVDLTPARPKRGRPRKAD